MLSFETFYEVVLETNTWERYRHNFYSEKYITEKSPFLEKDLKFQTSIEDVILNLVLITNN